MNIRNARVSTQKSNVNHAVSLPATAKLTVTATQLADVFSSL